MLDENVPVAIGDVFIAAGHTVERIQGQLPVGATDSLVAGLSEELGAVLVSFDRDFNRIAPRIPRGQRARFRRLSRIAFQCTEPEGARRLEQAMSLIEAEYALAQSRPDKRMIVVIGSSYIRTDR